jgi:dTDP-4-dehydrorhamnose 3,5-epimerase
MGVLGKTTRNVVDGVLITPLKRICVPGGDVLHAMKSSDVGYVNFGEAYFSTVEKGSIKGWKRHRDMTLNLIVPVGIVRFIIYDDRDNFNTKQKFQEVVLSKEGNYCRLTVPPMVWLGFQGLAGATSTILNIANFEYSGDEVDRKDLDEIKFNWSEK